MIAVNTTLGNDYRKHTTLGNDCGGLGNRLKTVARTQDFWQAALGEPGHLL